MVKKTLKWMGIGLGGVVAIAAIFLVYAQIAGVPRYPHAAPARHVEVTPERVADGRKLAMAMCTSCHLDPATGRLTGKVSEDAPPVFGVVYSRNITGSKTHGVGAWTDGELAYVIRTGVRPDGEYLPPWMVKLPQLSDDELDSIIAFLRSDDPLVAPYDHPPAGKSQPSLLTKVLTRLVMKPVPYPEKPVVAPPRTDRVAYGRYLVQSRDCYGCHSADFKTVNQLEPEKTPGYMGGGNTLVVKGEDVLTANLTADEKTGIGKWTEAEFSRALRLGIRPNGTVLHYPMLPHPELDEEQAGAMYTYLRSLPKLVNAVPRSRPRIPSGDDGLRAYHEHGCVSCHGDTGKAFADLRGANRDFPGDGQLLEWMLDAPRLRPGVAMPAFRGIIPEKDYPALLRHVRKLSSQNAGETASRN